MIGCYSRRELEAILPAGLSESIFKPHPDAAKLKRVLVHQLGRLWTKHSIAGYRCLVGAFPERHVLAKRRARVYEELVFREQAYLFGEMSRVRPKCLGPSV